jgi:lipoprotein-anchoring transpeptidase ErfK/SrfK
MRIFPSIFPIFVIVVQFFQPTPVLAKPTSVGLLQQISPESSGGEPYAGRPLCLPDIYLESPTRCLPLGPSVFLTEMGRLGLTFPEKPLPATKPDPTLSILKEQYLSVQSIGNIPVYASLANAASRISGRTIAGGNGLHYLVIIQRINNEQGIFYQLKSGEWINAGDISTACCVSSGRFQGLVFQETLPHAFGWVLSEVKTKTSPGYNSPDTGRQLNREKLVQIYATQVKDDTNWLMIGVEEWVDDQYVGRVSPAVIPPQGVNNGRWIEVNLAEQTLSVYDQGKLVFGTLIATGVKPFYTQPGLFPIYKKKELETMTGSFEPDRSDYYYLEDVPWTMYFDQARALHGAYWRTLYGYPASHGCVNLSPSDSQWLFQWAQEGDWVYVWDPTGKTPTDPKYYGAGGA